jgi:hypothetical protein
MFDDRTMRIERALGGIQNRLLTVLDLHRGGAATRGWTDDPARQGMAERLVEQTEERLRGFSLSSVVTWRPLVRGGALVAAAAAVLLGMQLGLGERFTTTLARLLDPTADIPPATWLQLTSPGDIEVLEGDPLEIAATVSRGSVEQVDLVISSADGQERREPMRSLGQGNFVTLLDGLDHDATYRFEGGGTWTRTHAIRLLHRPVIGAVVGRVESAGLTHAADARAMDSRTTNAQAPALGSIGPEHDHRPQACVAHRDVAPHPRDTAGPLEYAAADLALGAIAADDAHGTARIGDRHHSVRRDSDVHSSLRALPHRACRACCCTHALPCRR